MHDTPLSSTVVRLAFVAKEADIRVNEADDGKQPVRELSECGGYGPCMRRALWGPPRHSQHYPRIGLCLSPRFLHSIQGQGRICMESPAFHIVLARVACRSIEILDSCALGARKSREHA